MRRLAIKKVTVNISVGEGGEKLAKAEALLAQLTGQTPIKISAKSTNQTFGIRKGTPIACKVTLRGEKASNFLKRALEAIGYKIKKKNFDDSGNLSFGIKEHIDIPGVRYDPNVGIFGMDVCLTIERPGYRIKRRKIFSKRVSTSHSIKPEESITFMKEKYSVVLEEQP